MKIFNKPNRSATAPTSTVIDVPVDRLKPHPLQIALFQHDTDAELAALAQDNEERGLQQPIEVSPCFEIIGGHRRLAL
jgi:ParB-like chromosome segregation protein Spo0J